MSQPLLEIFQRVKPLLAKYQPPLVAVSDYESRYELVSQKPHEYLGRKRKEAYFAALIIQSSYVGLYLMHVYVSPEMLAKTPPDLRKCLKGKSCFHLKKIDDTLLMQIEQSLADGWAFYQQHGMV